MPRLSPRLWLAISLTVWGLSLLGPGSARAQSPGYNNFQVGDRALGLSGAFVGLADDASAAYHNPAGLAGLHGGSLSTSLWAAALQIDKISRGYETDLGTSGLDDFNVVGLPFFLAATVKFGDHDSHGRSRHALGFTLVSPYSADVSYKAQLEGTSEATGLPAADRYTTSFDEGTQWAGVSYAYLLSDKLSLGLTTFATVHTLSLVQSNTRAESGAIADQVPGSNRSLNADVSVTAYNLLFRLGAVWDVNERWRVGLMFQPPGPGVGGSLDYSLLGAGLDPVALSTGFNAVTDGNARLISHMPLEVRAGASYFMDEETRFTLDASVVGPGRLYGDTVATLGTLLSQPLLSDAYVDGPTVRAAVGGEYRAFFGIPLRTGLLMEISPSGPTIDLGEQVGMPFVVGGSLSVGILGEGYGIAIGTTITHEKGLVGLVELSPTSGEPAFVPSETARTTIYAFISGGSTAAKRVAGTLSEIVDVKLDGDDDDEDLDGADAHTSGAESGQSAPEPTTADGPAVQEPTSEPTTADGPAVQQPTPEPSATESPPTEPPVSPQQGVGGPPDP